MKMRRIIEKYLYRETLLIHPGEWIKKRLKSEYPDVSIPVEHVRVNAVLKL